MWRSALPRRICSLNATLAGVVLAAKNFILVDGPDVDIQPPIGVSRNRHTNAPIVLISFTCGGLGRNAGDLAFP